MSEKVLIGMSGGVDSSVAAYLLKEAGYEVIGVTMNLWSFEQYGGESCTDRGCCSVDAFDDARQVANSIGIPHYVLNMREEFSAQVVDNFKSEYLAGRTPNPCVLCNTKIKWQELLKKADQLGCKYLATGHYAKIAFNNQTSRYELQRGDDPAKDQSYFLWGLSQDALSRTLFPLADIPKTKVREIAAKMNLKVAEKKESMEICFIPDNNYKRFLIENSPSIAKITNGSIIDHNGKTMKQTHEGYPFYTIGQRKGLGGGFAEPMFVSAISVESNTVYIAPRTGLLKHEVLVNRLNWITEEIQFKRDCTAKIRFNTKDQPCQVERVDKDLLKLIFTEPVFAVTPGQSAVLFDGTKVLCGGLIV